MSLEKLVVRVAASLKVVAMIVDDRLLQGTAPWHSFMRPGGERKAAFRSKRLTAEDVDGLYTKAILLNNLLTRQAAEKVVLRGGWSVTPCICVIPWSRGCDARGGSLVGRHFRLTSPLAT